MRGINGRDDGIKVIVDRIFDGIVECLHLQRRRCRLHRHDIIPLPFGNGISYHSIQRHSISAETGISPLAGSSHLCGNDFHLW